MRCRAKAKTGSQCKKDAIAGGLVCRSHGGSAPAVKAKAAVRAELAAWGVTDELVDPDEVLMRLLAQAYRRAQLYSAELAAKVDELGLEKATVGIAFGEGGSEGEYVRGLAQIEADERDRAFGFACKALAAGIEERRVQLAERETSALEEFLRAVITSPAVGMTGDQRRAFLDEARRHLTAA